MKLTINVTTADIRNGIREDCDTCPIAIATKRTIGNITRVMVNKYSVLIGRNSYALPLEARDFVRRFDLGYYKLKSFSFDIEVGN